MKALEFKTKIKNNLIHIPKRIQTELISNKDKDIRVIVLIEDSEIYDELVFQQSASNLFLKGYADSDSIYDNY